MSDVITKFRLDGPAHAASVVEWLTSDVGFTASEPLRERRLICDTFDWRLYRAGVLLSERVDAVGAALEWSRLSDELPLRSFDGATMPRFAADLPAGPFRDRLAAIIEVRALLPLARLRSRCTTLTLKNATGKTVLGAVVEEHVLGGDDARAGRLVSRRLRLIPVRGYDKQARRVSRYLAAKRGLEPLADNLFDQALTLRRRRSKDYSSKLNIVLDGDMPAEQALRRILLTLLDQLETNLAGTKAHLDPEFLHDLRVAVRRTRAALSQIRAVLPAKDLKPFKEGFKGLGRMTGPSRDMDVYVERFDHYRAALPPDRRDALAPFLDFLLDHQAQAHDILSAQLESRHTKLLLADWRTYLKNPATGKRPRRAGDPVRTVADNDIWSIYQTILKRGRAIDKNSPAERLHDLRIDCKKLRYLMEFFRSLYPAKKIAKPIKALKDLQNNLGDFQDFEVQADALPRFAEQMASEGKVPKATRSVMKWLAKTLAKHQNRSRREFAARFAAFDSKQHRREYEQLFRSSKRRRPASSAGGKAGGKGGAGQRTGKRST